MTNEEAIIMIKTVEGHLLFDEKWKDAFDMAISALEKQIQKKPKKIPVKESKNLWHLYCPSCENWIGMWNSRLRCGDMHNISNRNICPYCGRAIDWSE